MVAQAILLLIGEIGMRGTIHIAQVIVIGRMLTGVAHKKADGSTRGAALEDTREELHLIRFVATGGHCTLSRTTATHLATHKVHIYSDACWHAVNHTAYTRPVRLAKRGKAKECTECIHCFSEKSHQSTVYNL